MVFLKSIKMCIKKGKCGQKKMKLSSNFISYIVLNILYCMAQFVFSTLFDTKRHNSVIEGVSKEKNIDKTYTFLLNLHKLYAIMLAKIVKTFVRLIMVNVLIGSKNTTELDILYQKLANDKNYRVENVNTGKDTITKYLKINPDILILDNSLPDMSIEEVVRRLSSNPLERKKCNTVLTLPLDYNIKMNRYEKISQVVYKPFVEKQLSNVVKEMAVDFNTPDLEVGEVDELLQSLNFNCLSGGYRYIRKAITYCYYRPEELEYLKNILNYLSYEFNTTYSQVRDSMYACIRPFKNASDYNCPKELFDALHNHGYRLSLKDFLEVVVLYLIRTKKKGRLF